MGIASPGIVNHDSGIIEYCCNIPSFKHFHICEAVRAGFPVPQVFAENDANTAAWGEAIAGDKAGTEVVDQYVYYLAQGISNIINIFQPEVLSIGGGISGEGDYLLDMLVPLVRAKVYGHDIVASADIRIAALGNDAGIIGGAVLGLK